MFDQITIDCKEAWSAPVDFSFKFVKQSAIQVFDNIVRKFVSMSDCKECLSIPLIFLVNVSAYDSMN